MELHLKQWRDHQHESEQQPSAAKISKLFLEPHQQQQQEPSGTTTGSSVLPLFVPEPTSSKVSSLSAFQDSTTGSFPKMGSYFSLSQWQELELQALIYRYILAGAVVPPELLQPIKKSLLHSSPYFLQHFSHYQPPLLQSTGYWGRAAMDPEPGRCRRTDGKKWRCSRDVVAGHKYCERHMHRGRNRSRKPVEIPTPNPTTTTTATAAASSPIIGGGAGGGCFQSTSTTIGASPLGVMANGTIYGVSGPSPSIDLLHFNRSSSLSNTDDHKHRALFESQNEVNNRSDGHILRHFFDDWPRSLEESNNVATTTSSNATTCLSISMPGNSSDVSLKLSTGIGGEEPGHGGSRRREESLQQLNWATGWTSNQVASMGGPLAEALRSSASHSSPTSVLHQLPRSSASGTSYVST
ncbi:hypothetical protein Dsin_006628 [Dipteronia sinensis]|uniref:Growth-regulating factor n=1 Tax=Dipteronia sinensis TaxID=43782 RepID=A0AAE0AYR6_9ROSI|nr:hypothetical protein Dsin_006628 [Dipteronia sinensis]